MVQEGRPNLIPENQYHGDPSMPFFRFSEDEKIEMRAKLMRNGMTKDEANAEIIGREKIIINKLARAQFNKERKIS